MVEIIAELPHHVGQRELLLDRAFGPRRRRKTAERLREGRLPADGLAFAAVDSGRLVGTLRLWDVVAGNAGPALLLGPLAVDRAHRGRGIGTMLMRRAIEEADLRGARIILLVGDEPYYSRFGFAKPESLALPGPVDVDRFLALELENGAVSGARGLVTASGRLQPKPALEPAIRRSRKSGSASRVGAR